MRPVYKLRNMIKSRTGRRLQNRGRYWSKLKVKLANSPIKCSTMKRSWQILIEKTGRSCSREPHQTKTKNQSSKTTETTACKQSRSVVSTICAEWKQGLGEVSTRSAGRLTNSCILVNWEQRWLRKDSFALPGSQVTGRWILETKGPQIQAQGTPVEAQPIRGNAHSQFWSAHISPLPGQMPRACSTSCQWQAIPLPILTLTPHSTWSASDYKWAGLVIFVWGEHLWDKGQEYLVTVVAINLNVC